MFHNDLENTTEALPQILAELKARGFEFVPVSELVYKDNYTIDANGEQSQIVQSSLDVNEIAGMSDDEIRAVIAQNADKLAAAGFTEEQALAAAAALKNNDDIPEEVQAVISQFADALPVSAGDGNDDNTIGAEDKNLGEDTADNDNAKNDPAKDGSVTSESETESTSETLIKGEGTDSAASDETADKK